MVRASRRSQNPTLNDWENIVQIFKYLKGTKHYGILFTKNNNIRTYVDADYGSDQETRRSTTGYVYFLGSAPTSWYSKLQHCVATSTAESEYYALCECAKHSLWYQNILKELGINHRCTKIFVDNQAAIHNAKNKTINIKSKHIDIKYHKIRELINEERIKLEYIKSKDNIADGFTKYLNSNKMTEFRNRLLYKYK